MIDQDRVKKLAGEFAGEVVGIRRHIHANPELSFQEHKTSEFIASKLDEYGIPYERGMAGTGIVAHIMGQKPEAYCIALRADMDALPIVEENEVEYCSRNKGVMHACGHDVHSASLLGTARILNELKEDWEGTVKLIFQPGEEKLPGGASMMIAEGVMENPKPDKVMAQHVFPELESGKVGFRPGMYMASCDEVYLTVKGKGGHGAMPQQNVDPVVISAQIILSLQQLVSRKASPSVPTVLSFGKIEANGATNVIPNEVQIAGTFRTMDEDWRAEAHSQIKQMAEGIALSMGAVCEVKIDKGYPFLVNDEEFTLSAKRASEEFLGSENVVDLPIRMTGEDFSYFSQHGPVCFYRLGVRNEQKGITAPVHNSRFDIDESSLETATGLMAWLVLSDLA